MPSATTHPDPGVNREQLRLLVERFYGAIREDAQLGPIFDQRVRDWDMHLDKMTRFWCSALLREGSYHGNPIEAHRFGGLSVELFDRWLNVFQETVDGGWSGPKADAAIHPQDFESSRD